MPDLAPTFEQNATEAAAIVWRCQRTPLAVRSSVERASEGSKGGIVLSDEEFLPPQLFASLRGLAGVILKPEDEQLATAGVGVTEAFAGVASTGSACVAMGRPLVAATSLLMPLNILLLASERIVERPRDLFNPDVLKGESLKRNLVFITGPSATADMGPLVRGVHGPHRVLILLLE
jgi:L-lactate dehydrogenase complex protein LldG